MKGTPPSGSKQLAFAQVPSKRDNVKYALLVSFAHLYSVLRIRGELQEGGAQGDTESLREQNEAILGLGTKDGNSGRLGLFRQICEFGLRNNLSFWDRGEIRDA